MKSFVRLPRNFDRNRIKGLVADLVRVTNMDFVAAVEKAAGGKLYNLVVDTSATAQFLLKNKCLKEMISTLKYEN